MNKLLLGSLLASLPMASMASDPFQHVDAYYVSTDFETAGGEDDGSGFGLSGAFRVGDQAVIDAEYQSAETDDFDIEIDQLRLGLGLHSVESTSGMTFYGQVEYLQFELAAPGVGSDDEDGFGLHGGVLIAATEQLRFKGELGYLTLDDVDGLEYTFGATFDITPQFGLFADYRLSALEDDDNDETDLTDVKLGVSMLF